MLYWTSATVSFKSKDYFSFSCFSKQNSLLAAITYQLNRQFNKLFCAFRPRIIDLIHTHGLISFDGAFKVGDYSLKIHKSEYNLF